MDDVLVSTTFLNMFLETGEGKEVQPLFPTPPQFTGIGNGGDLSITTTEDQNKIDKFITSYQDTITHSGLFEILKNYEVEFKQSSSEFYAKWKDGAIVSDPKTSEWATIYRVIYGND